MSRERDVRQAFSAYLFGFKGVHVVNDTAPCLGFKRLADLSQAVPP